MRILLILLWFTIPALAHKWYPSDCCSEKDCYEISQDDVYWTTSGWVIKATGEVWAFNKIRIPPDESIIDALPTAIVKHLPSVCSFLEVLFNAIKTNELLGIFNPDGWRHYRLNWGELSCTAFVWLSNQSRRQSLIYPSPHHHLVHSILLYSTRV